MWKFTLWLEESKRYWIYVHFIAYNTYVMDCLRWNSDISPCSYDLNVFPQYLTKISEMRLIVSLPIRNTLSSINVLSLRNSCPYCNSKWIWPLGMSVWVGILVKGAHSACLIPAQLFWKPFWWVSSFPLTQEVNITLNLNETCVSFMPCRGKSPTKTQHL